MPKLEYYAYVNKNSVLMDLLDDMLRARGISSIQFTNLGNGLMLYSFITDPELFNLLSASNSNASIIFSDKKLTNVSLIGQETGQMQFSGVLQDWVDNATAYGAKMFVGMLINTTTGEDNQLGCIHFGDQPVSVDVVSYGNGGSNIGNIVYSGTSTVTYESDATATFSYTPVTSDNVPPSTRISRAITGSYTSETGSLGNIIDGDMGTSYVFKRDATGNGTSVCTITISKQVKRGDVIWVKAAARVAEGVPSGNSSISMHGLTRSFAKTGSNAATITVSPFIMSVVAPVDADAITIVLTHNVGTSGSATYHTLTIYECDIIPLDQQY